MPGRAAGLNQAKKYLLRQRCPPGAHRNYLGPKALGLFQVKFIHCSSLEGVVERSALVETLLNLTRMKNFLNQFFFKLMGPVCNEKLEQMREGTFGVLGSIPSVAPKISKVVVDGEMIRLLFGRRPHEDIDVVHLLP